MSNEVKQEYYENCNLNNSDKKSHYNSSPDKKSDYDSSPEHRRRSRSPVHSRKRSRRDRSESRSASRSPASYKRIRYYGSRENPYKSRVLGVFGLSSRTIEDDLVHVFSYYGPIEDVRIIYDGKSGNSRGFGFIYFDNIDDASAARRECNGMRLNGKRIRVDYSITRRAHTPTPGVYMGFRSTSRDRHHSRKRSGSSYRRHRRSRSDSR